MTIIIFLLVLLVCVLVHEWGHFFAARRVGMLVEEFGFGIPPRIWGTKKGETVYSINALPIGGFVKIAGENGIEEDKPINRQFESKPWYSKALVLVAGVVMNIILALVLFTVAYTLGMPTVTPTGTPTVISVSPNSPASHAGLKVGVVVEKVLVDGNEVKPITTEALHEIIKDAKNDVAITVNDGEGTKEVISLIPEGVVGEQMIGAAIEPIGTVKANIFQAMHAAWLQTWQLAGVIVDTLRDLVVGLIGGKGGSVANLIGPVGLASEVKGAASIGFAYLLAFTAAISVNLAVLNIMPFPALDGARLLVVLLEAITKKKFSRKVVGYIHAAGFLLLLFLMVVLTIGDIRRLV